MDQLAIFGRLALAFGIGLAIEIERGWHTREAPEGSRALGVRSFALIGFLGGALGLVGQLTNDAVTAASVLGFFALLIGIYVTGLSRIQDRGATTEIAAALTLLLGIVAMRGDMAVAAASAAILVAVLDLKQPLHTWLTKVDDAELAAGIKLLVISLVVLPVLPNQGFGPGDVINPYILWWIVVVVVAISFAAHAAMRILGPKAGALFTGLFGGLASSTAVAITFARLAAKSPQSAPAAAAGIAVASSVMFARALIVPAILYPPVAAELALPMILAGGAALGIALIFSSAKQKSDEHWTLGASANFGMAVRFALALGAIAVVTYYGRMIFGLGGAVASAAVGGLVDVDATTVTMARLGATGESSISDVVIAVLVAVAVNMGAKATYAIAIAGRIFVVPMLVIFLVPVGVLVGAYVFL